MFPKKLSKKIQDRQEDNALRELSSDQNKVDFSSNDYLGFSKSLSIYKDAIRILENHAMQFNGATGSRLLSGNYHLYDTIEQEIADYFNAETALIFNSGYDANIGFFSSIPQKGDLILYDELIHASIRDGIQMSLAKSYKFKHNNINDLLKKAIKWKSSMPYNESMAIYVVTESVFSMDGDTPDFEALISICNKEKFHLIVDEAHAIGVFGKGILCQKNFDKDVFARIITFGKAMGCHGAAVLGSKDLKTYLSNFARSFIYTTALPPHSLATIKAAFDYLKITYHKQDSSIKKLQDIIVYFNTKMKELQIDHLFIESVSAIHCCIVPGNHRVKKIANLLQQKGYDVKPILSPTVKKGEERLRFCLHAYNTHEEVTKVLGLLRTFANK